MPKVLVSDPIAKEGIELLKKCAEVDVKTGLPADELRAIIGHYDALAVRSETKVTADILEAATRLRIIGRAGVGVDNIDVPKATEKGIVVVNSPEGNTIAAAELTVAMLLSLARKIPHADRSIREGKWDRKSFVGSEVYDKTLGIIGLGKIGREVAKRAKSFEMKVIAYDPFANHEQASMLGVELVVLEELYRVSDFITLHVPFNSETRNMIGAPQLAMMKDGVRIINCARGGVVDEAALVEAIKAGKVAGAAFDVYSKEPIAPDNPLRGLDAVITTPHLGASTTEAQINVAIDIAEQIADVLQGRQPRSAVNMPALSSEVMAEAAPYLELGTKIGSLHTQLARQLDGSGTPIQEMEILYQGHFGEMPLAPITRAVLQGLLTPMLSDPVNLVNAPTLAAARGIRVTESHSDTAIEYNAMLTVRACLPDGCRTICGTVLSKSDIRIVHVDGYHVDIVPDGTMVFTQHIDKPGIIGAVGTLLGQNGVNIAGMNVGREKVGGRALMVLLVDDPITDALLRQIRAVPGMEKAQVVQL